MKKIIFVSLLFLLACNKPHYYVIKAGNHYSTHGITPLFNDVINYSFTTDSTWVWDVPDKNVLSKVTGIAWNSNHKNSVRVVYKRKDSIGVIGYYYYIDWVSPQQNHVQKGVLDTIVIGNTYQGRLGYENGYFFVTLNNKHNSMVGPQPRGVKTIAYPYIGGTYTINHDWKTTLTWND